MLTLVHDTRTTFFNGMCGNLVRMSVFGIHYILFLTAKAYTKRDQPFVNFKFFVSRQIQLQKNPGSLQIEAQRMVM